MVSNLSISLEVSDKDFDPDSNLTLLLVTFLKDFNPDFLPDCTVPDLLVLGESCLLAVFLTTGFLAILLLITLNILTFKFEVPKLENLKFKI